MRHVDEYRDARAIAAVVARIHKTASRRWSLMEVCGGQTHSGRAAPCA
jgi:hydrogenase expression/formation protein HypD